MSSRAALLMNSRVITRSIFLWRSRTVDGRCMVQKRSFSVSEKDGKWYMLGSQTVSQLGLSVLDIREDEERKAFMKGLRASLSGTVNEEIMTPANRKTIEGIMEERKAEREKKFAAQVEAQNRKASDEMLAKARSEAGAVELPSGVVVRRRVAGEGERVLGKDGVERDEERRVLTMMYEGRLPDGSVFDSTDRKKGAVRHRLAGLVEGMAEALRGERAGAVLQMTIPAHLAYGAQGMGPVPPHSALRFDVQVLAVEDREPDRELTVDEAKEEFAREAEQEGGELTADQLFQREAAAAAETLSRMGLPGARGGLGAPRNAS